MDQPPITEAGVARPMSLEEWAALPEDEPGELVDGRLVAEEDVGYGHEIVVVWLTTLLRLWIAPRGGLVGGPHPRPAVRAGLRSGGDRP